MFSQIRRFNISHSCSTKSSPEYSLAGGPSRLFMGSRESRVRMQPRHRSVQHEILGIPALMCGESEARSVDTHTRALSITVRSHAASLLPPSVLVFGGRPTIAFHRVRLPGNHEKNVSQGMLPTRIRLATTPVRSKAQVPPFAQLRESGVLMFTKRPKWFCHGIFAVAKARIRV